MLFKSYPIDICFLSNIYQHFFAPIFWQGPYYNNVMARHTIPPGVCTNLERSGDHIIVIWSLSELDFKICPKPMDINLCYPQGDQWTLRRAFKPSKDNVLVSWTVAQTVTRRTLNWPSWMKQLSRWTKIQLVQGSGPGICRTPGFTT